MAVISSLSGFGAETRRGGRSSQGGQAQAAGLEVRGVSETAGNLREWGALQAYITAFTAERVARRVLSTAKKHVPYDTGELYDSGHVERVEGANLNITVIKENIEGTEEYSTSITALQPSFQKMDYFGTAMRTFNKYAVIFDAPHAALVHETILNYNQAEVSHSGRAMPPGRPKMDHYLLFAYNQHKDEYSRAMIENTAALNAAWEARKLGQKTAEQKGFGLSTGAQKPRLVKRT